MKPTTEQVYKKINELSNEVSRKFLKNGIVLPSCTKQGAVRIGHFIIEKNSGFYSIVDSHGNTVINNINLPHTALLLANNLALGKYLDNKLLDADKQYGYAAFEESVQKRALRLSKDPNRYCLMLDKLSISKVKKENSKKYIIHSFEKLRKFV
jgi:hypothetical protein